MQRIVNVMAFMERGFTMLELMIVVAVLAAVAGAVIFAHSATEHTVKTNLAYSEMQEIKQALLRFRQDTGHFPDPVAPAEGGASPANFSALFVQGLESAWNPAARRGWRGPYLREFGEGRVDIGDDLLNDGSGNPVTVNVAAIANIRGVADPFAAYPTLPASYTRCDETPANTACLLDWRTLADDGDGDDDDGDRAFAKHGRPYLAFDLDDNNRARLMSMGPNGRYEGITCAVTAPCNQCAANGDDILMCLLR